MSDTFGEVASRILAAASGRAISEEGFVVVVSPAVRTLYRDSYRRLTTICRAAGARSVLPVDSAIPAFAAAYAARAESATRAAGAQGAAETALIGERGGGILVLSACPAASDFIAAEYPSLKPAMLRIPSPMAICAGAALSDAGIPGGTAIALSPCSIKKREERLVDFDMRVLSVHSFVAALGESGLELASFPESDYDRPFPARDGDDCGIACSVAGLLSESGMPFVSSFAAEGLPAARTLMGKLLAAREAGTKGISVVELTFCEGGCLRDPLEDDPGSGIHPQ